MKLQFDRTALEELADRIIKRTLAMDLTWDWPCGVAFYGVSRAYAATGRQEYIDALAKWVDEYMGLGLPGFSVNACAMGHALLALYAASGDARYKSVIDEKLDYLQNRALRFGDRVLQHTVSARNDFPEQCWADTLFMAAYFMLRAGAEFGDAGLVADALHQYDWHIRYLHDRATGLWFHGYDNIRRDHMSGFHWARANAWAAYTMSRVKSVLPEPYLYPAYMSIDCSLRDLLAAARRLQMDDGLWHTLLDDPESYGEASASAGLAAAMLCNGNPLHAGNAQRALDGIIACVAPDGQVTRVSGGTAVMRDREGYRSIPADWAQGWGQGLALALLARALEDGAQDGAKPGAQDGAEPGAEDGAKPGAQGGSAQDGAKSAAQDGEKPGARAAGKGRAAAGERDKAGAGETKAAGAKAGETKARGAKARGAKAAGAEAESAAGAAGKGGRA
ncbi:MAG: glycoside hydrolase family 88 protein [Clostridiales bacterium]|nr:glycoside hydrolase family 88 protein [Clostridiales bacterium]